MSEPSRVWFDVSFSRTQSGVIGITRTVRRFLAATAENGEAVGALAYHPRGYREVADAQPASTQGERMTAGQALYRRVTGPLAWWLVIAAVRVVPWPLLRPAWQLAADVVFGALSRDAPPARLRPGDLVVIADVAWNYAAWRAVRRAQQAGARVVLFVHDLMPMRRPEFCFPLVPKVYVTFMREMLACVDAVVCNSRATEDDLRAWAAQQGLRLPPVSWVHLGCDVSPAAAHGPVRPELLEFLARPGPCFASVGSFEPKKNFPFLLRAFESLWAQGESCRLVLAGKPTAECADFIDTLRDHPQRGQRLLVLHDASDAELAAIYSGSRALVLPSLFEGFGLPLVEARSRGCRVVASDLPSFAELADGGVLLYDRTSAAALVDALRTAAQVTSPPPPYTAGLSWRESARLLVARCRDAAAEPGQAPAAGKLTA